MTLTEERIASRLKAQCDCDVNDCTATGSPLKSLGGHRKGCVCSSCFTGRPVKKTPIRAKAKPGKALRTGRLKEGSAELRRQKAIAHERSGGRCQLKVHPQCSGKAEGVHHVKSRSRGGSDTAANFLSACNLCNGWVEDNPKAAREKGLTRHFWEPDPSEQVSAERPVKTFPKTTANTLKLQSMTEKEFQQWVVDLATRLRWLTYHTYDSRRSNPGFPDLVLVRGGRVIFAELKREKGKATPEQDKWLNALRVASDRNESLEAYLWRPSDRDEIEAVLKRAA